MATIHIRGKTRDGESVHEITFPDSRVADVLSAVVHVLHGPGPKSHAVDGARATSHAQGQGTRPPPTRRFMTDDEAIAVYNGVPSAEDVRKYILKQPDRMHSLGEIARNLIGRTPSAQSTNHVEKRAFFLLQDRVSEARRIIAKEDRGGEFVRDKPKVGASRVYRWKRP